MSNVYSLLEPGEPVPASELDALEKNLGFLLPEEYREFLLACNGGYASDQKGRFEIFHPFRKVTGEHVGVDQFFSAQLTLKKPSNRMVPDHCLVIASDAGGNLIVLSCRETDFGAIYWCDLNYYNDDGEFTVRLASTFTDFYRSLIPAS